MKIKGVGFVAIPGEMTAARERYSLLLTALAPVVPQIIGSAFNIWYNTTVIQPLLVSPSLKQRFFDTVVVYNSVVYPVTFCCGSDEFSRFVDCSIVFARHQLSILRHSQERAAD